MKARKAVLVTRHKDVSPEGWITELVIWRLPAPVPPCRHRFKYRLAFVVGGRRVIGFDNERGKGDHFHIGGTERPYRFRGIEQLLEGFIREIERWRSARSR